MSHFDAIFIIIGTLNQTWIVDLGVSFHVTTTKSVSTFHAKDNVKVNWSIDQVALVMV